MKLTSLQDMANNYKEGYYSIPVRPMFTTPHRIRHIEGLSKVAQAQLEACEKEAQERVREIFDEMDRRFLIQPVDMGIYPILNWSDIKQKYLHTQPLSIIDR